MCLKAGQTPDCMQVKKWLNLLSPCIWWTSYTETTVTWRVLYKNRSILRKDTKREFELFHRNRNINSKGITFLKTLNRVCYFFFQKLWCIMSLKKIFKKLLIALPHKNFTYLVYKTLDNKNCMQKDFVSFFIQIRWNIYPQDLSVLNTKPIIVY